MTPDADDVAPNVGPELKFAEALSSVAAVPDVTGMIANGLEKESDKEPSKSISAPLEVTGAPDHRGSKISVSIETAKPLVLFSVLAPLQAL